MTVQLPLEPVTVPAQLLPSPQAIVAVGVAPLKLNGDAVRLAVAPASTGPTVAVLLAVVEVPSLSVMVVVMVSVPALA